MSSSLHLFEGYGVELEYMLVDKDTMNVLPVTDEMLRAVAGSYESEIEMGDLAWSNELVLHVIELKTNGPAPRLTGLAAKFQADIRRINDLAVRLGGMLLPGAIHPWMDPETETKLWPHEYSPVYESFNRIFGCRGHGWSNLQSTHVNLPFCGDEEFGRLHAAIRLILPILPALAAASPICDGRPHGDLDARLAFYRSNAARIPLVTGRVIPERAYSKEAYYRDILRPLYAAIAPHDPDGILQHEFLNSRGAMARFDRGSIEIRLLDIQECAQADLAIVQLVCETVRALVDECWTSTVDQQAWEVDPLADLLVETIHAAGDTPLTNRGDYVRLFGADVRHVQTAEDLWRHLFHETVGRNAALHKEVKPLEVILEHGCLSKRVMKSTGTSPSRERLMDVYRRLADCLAKGEMFIA